MTLAQIVHFSNEYSEIVRCSFGIIFRAIIPEKVINQNPSPMVIESGLQPDKPVCT